MTIYQGLGYVSCFVAEDYAVYKRREAMETPYIRKGWLQEWNQRKNY